MNSKPCQTSVMELFAHVVTAFLHRLIRAFCAGRYWLFAQVVTGHLPISLLASEANSQSCQTSKMELFAKIVKS